MMLPSSRPVSCGKPVRRLLRINFYPGCSCLIACPMVIRTSPLRPSSMPCRRRIGPTRCDTIFYDHSCRLLRFFLQACVADPVSLLFFLAFALQCLFRIVLLFDSIVSSIRVRTRTISQIKSSVFNFCSIIVSFRTFVLSCDDRKAVVEL